MKRIIKKEEEYDALKPLYGTRGQPPFYDPNDLHVHVWHKGKLGCEENPKVPIYNKSKLNIKDCIYCKICHKVKDIFQSTVGDNKDIIENALESTLTKINEMKNYLCIIPPKSNETIQIELVNSRIFDLDNQRPKIADHLFIANEGIMDDYVIINSPKQ